ncbi:MAG: hypothetical protein HY062_15790 [Bacteroidetes bacterium]|nr:hypothetical protein [Bacteroidota bacterium]
MRFKIPVNIRHSLFLFCLFVFVVNITTSLIYKHSGPKDAPIYGTMYGSDARGYYEYLEWGISKKDINYESNNSYKRGNQRILKYPYGTALFQLPFYVAASVSQKKESGNNTYTQTDDVFMCIGASIYISLALFLLYQLLGKFTSDTSTKYLVVALIYLATNLFHYSSIELMMSHLYSFLSVTGYFYFTLHYIETRNKKQFLISIFFLFLIIAVRPFNAIIVIPVIIYLYVNMRSFWQVLVSIAIIAFSFFIQLILWRLQCGFWTFASYDGEGFYWTKPQLLNVWFSFRKGLFIYSPILFIAFIGLLMKLRTSFKITILFLSIFLIFTYTISCWWHWPYGDSFGHRAFIDVYAVLAIGLVSVMDSCKSMVQKRSLQIVCALCVLLNLFQTWQFDKFILSPEYMSYKKYKTTFLETNTSLTSELGGPKDIFPYNAKYTMVNDSMAFIDMNHVEYSSAIKFIAHPTEYKKCYADVNFIKEERLPNQSFKARLLFQITDTITKENNYFGCCLNEGADDFLSPNSTRLSYQFDFSALKPTEVLSVFCINPERKNFSIKHLNVSLYYIY